MTIRIPAPRTILSRPTAECAKSEKKKKKKVESSVKKSKSRSYELEVDGDFVCGLDGCQQRFRRKYDINRHRKRSERHGEKLQCTVCPKKLSRPDSLRRHMQRKHGVVWSMREGEEEEPEKTNVSCKTKKRRIMSAGSEEDEGEASICLRQRAPEKMRIAFVMNPTEAMDDVDPTSDSDFVDE